MERSPRLEFSQPIAIILVGIIIAGVIVVTNYYRPSHTAAQTVSQQLPASVHVRPPSSSDHIIGSPNAPIVLIEYTDFQCPYCQMLYPTLKQIVNESNGNIAWVMRDFPLYQIHPEAENAANAAECIAAQAGNTGFWKFADTVFANQDNLGPDFYAQIAQSTGINMQQYTSCVAAKTYQSSIDASEAEAEANGGQGTPYTIVYGHGLEVPISGALPYTEFESIIQTVQAQ